MKNVIANGSKPKSTGPESGFRMLPVVTYERKKFFFDERLRQLRNLENPYAWMDLNEFEMEYFRKKTRGYGR